MKFRLGDRDIVTEHFKDATPESYVALGEILALARRDYDRLQLKYSDRFDALWLATLGSYSEPEYAKHNTVLATVQSDEKISAWKRLLIEMKFMVSVLTVTLRGMEFKLDNNKQEGRT